MKSSHRKRTNCRHNNYSTDPVDPVRPRRLLADYESIVPAADAALSVINPPTPSAFPPCIPWYSCSRIDGQRRNLSSRPLSLSLSFSLSRYWLFGDFDCSALSVPWILIPSDFFGQGWFTSILFRGGEVSLIRLTRVCSEHLQGNIIFDEQFRSMNFDCGKRFEKWRYHVPRILVCLTMNLIALKYFLGEFWF